MKRTPKLRRHRCKKLLRLECAIDHRAVWKVEKLRVEIKLLLPVPIPARRQKLCIPPQPDFCKQTPESTLHHIPLVPSAPSQLLLRRKMGIQNKAISKPYFSWFASALPLENQDTSNFRTVFRRCASANPAAYWNIWLPRPQNNLETIIF